jgi:hypothetical protein
MAGTFGERLGLRRRSGFVLLATTPHNIRHNAID